MPSFEYRVLNDDRATRELRERRSNQSGETDFFKNVIYKANKLLKSEIT